MTTTSDEAIDKATARTIWTAVLILLAACAVCSQCSCTAHHPPTHIDLPQPAAVDKLIGEPARKAQASNDQAVLLAKQAESIGIAAGSAAAHSLTLATTETRQQVTNLLEGTDTLTAHLLGKQKEVDALEKDDAQKTRQVVTEKARGDREETAHHFWRRWCILGLLFAEILVSLIGAKLQEWSRAAERFALHEAEAGAKFVGGWLLKIPMVAKWVLKIGAFAAMFI